MADTELESDPKALFTLSWLCETYDLSYPLVLQAAARLKLQHETKLNLLRYFSVSECERLLKEFILPSSVIAANDVCVLPLAPPHPPSVPKARRGRGKKSAHTQEVMK